MSIDPELAQRCIIDFGFRPQTVFHKPEIQIIEEKKYSIEKRSVNRSKPRKG